MAQVCQITGKRPQRGQKVSHANNKSKRDFNVNLHSKRFWLEKTKRWVTLRVSTRAMRTIDKLGIEKVLEKIEQKKGK